MWHDVAALQQASNVDAPLAWCNPYQFNPPIAPHLAAAQAQVNMELTVMQAAYAELSQLADVVVVEGAGGFLVPVNATQTLADFAQQLNLPVILVVGMRLGCINHALLTVAAIQARGLPLAGWVANCMVADMPMLNDNILSLTQRISAPLLGVVPFMPEVTAREAARCLLGDKLCL